MGLYGMAGGGLIVAPGAQERMAPEVGFEIGGKVDRGRNERDDGESLAVKVDGANEHEDDLMGGHARTARIAPKAGGWVPGSGALLQGDVKDVPDADGDDLVSGIAPGSEPDAGVGGG